MNKEWIGMVCLNIIIWLILVPHIAPVNSNINQRGREYVWFFSGIFLGLLSGTAIWGLFL